MVVTVRVVLLGTTLAFGLFRALGGALGLAALGGAFRRALGLAALGASFRRALGLAALGASFRRALGASRRLGRLGTTTGSAVIATVACAHGAATATIVVILATVVVILATIVVVVVGLGTLRALGSQDTATLGALTGASARLGRLGLAGLGTTRRVIIVTVVAAGTFAAASSGGNRVADTIVVVIIVIVVVARIDTVGLADFIASVVILIIIIIVVVVVGLGALGVVQATATLGRLGRLGRARATAFTVTVDAPLVATIAGARVARVTLGGLGASLGGFGCLGA